MRLNFLLSTSVGLALALGPIAANAQTYDAVKRKAREVNARQATKRQQPPSWQVECKAKADRTYAMYQSRFPELDQRAREVAKSGYSLTKDRLVTIDWTNKTGQVTELKADNLSKFINFNAEIYGHYKSTSQADYANNAVVEKFIAVYYVAMGRTPALSRVHDGLKGPGIWTDFQQYAGFSCREQKALSEKLPQVILSVGIRADGQKNIIVCLPWMYTNWCWDGESPYNLTSEYYEHDEEVIKQVRDYIRDGVEKWNFDSLRCPDTAEFEFKQCRLVWDRVEGGSVGYQGKGYLGIAHSPVTPETAAALGLDTVSGELIHSVVSEGPADTFGLQAGDIIYAVNGIAVNPLTGLSLAAAVSNIDAGTQISVAIIRGGAQKLVLDVVLGNKP
jgi:hypothetical protein